MNDLLILDDLFNAMDKAFMPSNTIKQSLCSSNFPFSDIYEEDGNYIIEVGLAGYSEKDVTVDYSDYYINVTGKAPVIENKDNRHYKKCGLKFPQEFTVKFGINITEYDVSKCKVTMENGILKIVVPPKKDFIKSKTFAINAK